jgi:hypothetical protein
MKIISINPIFLAGICNPIFLLGFCILCIVINTVFMQFLHYDSQYRLVNPQHYNVDVITQEDYKQLSNPANRSVKLSSGNTLAKAEAWNTRVLPKYKSVNNGSQYVLVTLRGTAPFMHQWYSGVLPIFIVCSFGLFCAIKQQKQKQMQKEIV